MPNICFIPCPIEPNKGQPWQKLRDSPGPWTLDGVAVEMAEALDLAFIKSDTFPSWTRQNFGDLMQFFYKIRNPCLIILYFTDARGNQKTTAQGYSTRNHRYYLDMIGRDFTPLVKKKARDLSGPRGSMDGPKDGLKKARMQTRRAMIEGGGNIE